MHLLLVTDLKMVVSTSPRFCLCMKTLILSMQSPSLRFDDWFNGFECRYLKKLVSFTHDRAGNIGNLSRIDPSLLGVKDSSAYIRNVLYLHGASVPLLCFSLVLITHDNHESGRFLGSGKEYALKDVAGVMLTMELERFIAVLGLCYNLPYVPDDDARREHDLLHLSMIDNAFSFLTGMMPRSGECSLELFYTAGLLMFFFRMGQFEDSFFEIYTEG